jgi:alpha-tubulin suppressor-like RCC1 family protein
MAELINWSMDGASNTSGVIASDGKLAVWGGTNSLPFGSLGNASGKSLPFYFPLPSGRTVKSAVIGNNVVVIYDNGSVQVIGFNPYSQLGQNTAGAAITSLTNVSLANSKLGKKAVSSINMIFILCTDGSIQGSGDDKHGFIDGTSIIQYSTFTNSVPFSGKNFVDIAGVRDGLATIDSSGNVYFMGNWGSFTSNSLVQKSLPSGYSARQIFASDRRAFVICTDGSLFMIGQSGGGSLGFPGVSSNYTELTAVTLPAGQTAQWIGVGQDSTSMVTLQGKVYSTGTNGYGQLGIGDYVNQENWVEVTSLASGKTPIAIQYGVLHSVLIYNDGTIQTTGFNTNKTLGTTLEGSDRRNTYGSIDNISGVEIKSIVALGVQIATSPGAPTGVSAVAANRQATVSFTPPVSTGGSAITGYTVTSSPGNIDVSGASSPLTVTGLTNGTAYTFTVKAGNAIGTGEYSLASSAVTPSINVLDLNSGNISTSENDVVVASGRTITAKKQEKSAGAVTYAPDAANKPSVTISSIPASVQNVTIGVSAPDASGIAVVKIVAQAANGSLVTNFVETPLTVRVTLPGFTSNMVTIQTSATLGGSITDTITAYKVGINVYEFTTTHLTYFSASEYVPCFVAGTRIMTAEGYKAVETLTADDLIRTADNRIVSFRMFKTQITTTSPETAPYTIPANTFGRACPATEMTISPYHAIQSAPGVWQIPKYASQMFSGITQAPAGRPITYYHLELPNYFKDNIVAEGTVVESYGNRQTAGMKAVYRLNAERTGFTRMEKAKSASKTA